MVSVKERTSLVLMPSCPAASETAAISVALEAVDFDKSRMPCLIVDSCSSVPSTVFLTPAKASSKSTAAFVALTRTPEAAATERR